MNIEAHKNNLSHENFFDIKYPKIIYFDFPFDSFKDIKIDQPGFNEIHVWKIRVSSLKGDIRFFDHLLSNKEKEKAVSYRFKKDRDKSIISRGSLRFILGRYLSKSPDKITFKYGKWGKPELAGFDKKAGFSFNISHSGDIVLIGVSKFKSLGIDVEYIREMDDFLSLAKDFFHPEEVKKLKSIPENLRNNEFFKIWTAKEAYLKFCGRGLLDPLNLFYFSKPINGSCLKQVIDEKNIQIKNIFVHSISPDKDYLGALVFKLSNL